MTSKASNQRDITDVIKKQKRDNKKAAGITRAQASGISGSDTAIAGGPKTQAGSAGTSNVTQDLLMNTFDIRDVDRLYFSTTAGSTDVLTENDTGIESKSYYNGTSYVSVGMSQRVPANNVFTFAIGATERFNIGTSISVLNSNLGLGGYLDIGDNYIQVDDTTSTLVGTVPANERRMFSDSNNNSELSVKKSDGSVVSLESTASSGADLSLSNLNATGEAHFANPTLSNLNSTGEAHFAAPTLSNLGTTSLNAQLNLNSQRIINTDWLSFNSTSTPSSGLAVYTDTADVWVRNASGAVNLTTGLLTTSANNTFTGTNYFDTTASGSTTSAPIKFQGDGNNTAQRVLEIGKYGAHGVQFIGEILGDTGRSMTNPDGGADIPVPGTNEPAITIKAAMIMNTYTMYDLDTLVFSQGVSSTTPPPANDWVYIEANTGTSGTPNLTGMTYNVPTSKTHQFKINGTQVASIGANGLSGSEIGTGTVAAARLGTGSSITSKFLRGDNTWQTVSGGSGGATVALDNLSSPTLNVNINANSKAITSLLYTSYSAVSLSPLNGTIWYYDGELRGKSQNGGSFIIEGSGSGPTLSADQTWTGTNTYMGVNASTVFKTTTSTSTAYTLQLIQNSNSPSNYRTLANIDFMAENSSSQDEVYARISASSQDYTNGTEDGLLQLGVVSAGTLVSGIDIEGGTNASTGAKIGFFGKTPVTRQSVSTSASNSTIVTALKNLGLFY